MDLFDEKPPLSPRLEEVLTSISDGAYAGRLRAVYEAAAVAIKRLSELDLSSHEDDSPDSAPGLELWEALAPVIRDTVVDVNTLLQVLRENFPTQPEGGLVQLFADADGGSGQAVEQIMQETYEALAREVGRIGTDIRSPKVMSDRWNLLGELQSFRARFREQIGRMVLSSASVFQEVQIQEVVPFIAEEMGFAARLRAAVVDLTRLLRARRASLQESAPAGVIKSTQQLQKELDAFSRTTAFKAMRALDKREVVRFRVALRELSANPLVTKEELGAALDPFLAFVESLSSVNRRELLLAHDREVSAACGVMLEQANQLAQNDPASGCATLAAAATRAQALYGRDPQLDTYLRKVKKQPPAGLSGAQLQQELELFGTLLASLPLY